MHSRRKGGMKIATYLKNNSLVKEFADWCKEETNRDDFYLGAYTDGELFVEIENVEIPFKSAIKFLRNPQKQFRFQIKGGTVVKSARQREFLKAHLKMSERQLRLQICKMMLYKGWVGGKVNTTGTYLARRKSYIFDRYLFKGLPDLLFFRGRNYLVQLAIECKSQGNTQTEHQRQFQEVFHNPKLKRFYILAYSWKDVEKVLNREMLN